MLVLARKWKTVLISHLLCLRSLERLGSFFLFFRLHEVWIVAALLKEMRERIGMRYGLWSESACSSLRRCITDLDFARNS